MPPAAHFDFITALEEPYDSIEDVGCIEVEAVQGSDQMSVVTRIRMLPRDMGLEEFQNPQRRQPKSLSGADDSRYDYFGGGNEKCLADSFDSVDEIEENSNEARLIKSLVSRATVIPYNRESGLGSPYIDTYVDHSLERDDPYFLNETEAKYLDVLDRHLQDTDPESMSFADLEVEPDEPHPNKTMANMDQIMEHLLDNPCCECSPMKMERPLKSSLRPPRWTYRNGSRSSPGSSSSLKDLSVQFKEVDIREFNMTLGNHPSATSGPPVMIDWDSPPKTAVLPLEKYEEARQPRRNRRQLKLSLQERHNILVKEKGFSFEEVKGAWQEALEIRKRRKETLERGLALMKWDEVWESMGRKFSRLVDR